MDHVNAKEGWCCDGRTWKEHHDTEGHCCQSQHTHIGELSPEGQELARRRIGESAS